jgi:hypothetical protein
MTVSLRQMSVRVRLGFLVLAPIVMLFALLVFLPPDGVERRLGAIYRAVSSAVDSFPDRAYSRGTGVGICRKESPFPSRASVDLVLALATNF